MPYFVDLIGHTIAEVRVPEVEEIRSTVVIGDVLWVYGYTEGQARLISIEGNSRALVDLPREEPNPALGCREDRLMLVYDSSIIELQHNRAWREIYASPAVLPQPGPPPQGHGNFVYLRDEGRHEDNKRLWWLNLETLELTNLAQDTGWVGPNGPRWENNYSYVVDSHGDLWATAGTSPYRQSLLHRVQSGDYVTAVFQGTVDWDVDPEISTSSERRLDISAVALGESGLLLAGQTGLYSLVGESLSPLVLFENTEQLIGRYHWGWDPSNLVQPAEGSYVISGAFGGIYLVSLVEGSWAIVPLDESDGEALVW